MLSCESAAHATRLMLQLLWMPLAWGTATPSRRFSTTLGTQG